MFGENQRLRIVFGHTILSAMMLFPKGLFHGITTLRIPIIIAELVAYLLLLHTGLFAQQNWQWVNPLPQGNDLNDVIFVDINEGWTVGDVGTILHTTDGGWN